MRSSVYSLLASTGKRVPLLHFPGTDVCVLVCRVSHTSHNIPYPEGKLHTNVKTLVKVFIFLLLEDQFKMHPF